MRRYIIVLLHIIIIKHVELRCEKEDHQEQTVEQESSAPQEMLGFVSAVLEAASVKHGTSSQKQHAMAQVFNSLSKLAGLFNSRSINKLLLIEQFYEWLDQYPQLIYYLLEFQHRNGLLIHQ